LYLLYHGRGVCCTLGIHLLLCGLQYDPVWQVWNSIQVLECGLQYDPVWHNGWLEVGFVGEAEADGDPGVGNMLLLFLAAYTNCVLNGTTIMAINVDKPNANTTTVIISFAPLLG